MDLKKIKITPLTPEEDDDEEETKEERRDRHEERKEINQENTKVEETSDEREEVKRTSDYASTIRRDAKTSNKQEEAPQSERVKEKDNEELAEKEMEIEKDSMEKGGLLPLPTPPPRPPPLVRAPLLPQFVYPSFYTHNHSFLSPPFLHSSQLRFNVPVMPPHQRSQTTTSMQNIERTHMESSLLTGPTPLPLLTPLDSYNPSIYHPLHATHPQQPSHTPPPPSTYAFQQSQPPPHMMIPMQKNLPHSTNQLSFSLQNQQPTIYSPHTPPSHSPPRSPTSIALDFPESTSTNSQFHPPKSLLPNPFLRTESTAGLLRSLFYTLPPTNHHASYSVPNFSRPPVYNPSQPNLAPYSSFGPSSSPYPQYNTVPSTILSAPPVPPPLLTQPSQSSPPSPPLTSMSEESTLSPPHSPTHSQPAFTPSAPSMRAPNSPEEGPPSALELRIRRILREQEDRHTIAYHHLEHKINQIRQLAENTSQSGASQSSADDAHVVADTLTRGSFAAIEALANYNKTGSLSCDVVDSSSFRANSALYSHLKVSSIFIYYLLFFIFFLFFSFLFFILFYLI